MTLIIFTGPELSLIEIKGPDRRRRTPTEPGGSNGCLDRGRGRRHRISTSQRVARAAVLGAGLLAAWPVLAQLPFPEVAAMHVRAWQGPPRRAVVVDCRTAAEYERGHVPGAVNLPPDRLAAAGALLPRDQATTLIFYCRGGG